MELLREITVETPDGRARITLWHGDLTRLPPELAVDLLLVSVFPYSYAPGPRYSDAPRLGTLIGALDRAGLSVEEQARDKAVDLRSTAGFWLSKPLGDIGLNIDRVLCVEHPAYLAPESQFRGLFRNLGPLLPAEGARIATAPHGISDEGCPLKVVLPALLEAAAEWMHRGLEVRELMIVDIDRGRAKECAAIIDELARAEEPKLAEEPAERSAPILSVGGGRSSAIKRTVFYICTDAAVIGIYIFLIASIGIRWPPGLLDALVLGIPLAFAALLIRRMFRFARLWETRRIRYMRPPYRSRSGDKSLYDVFLSYTSKDEPAAEALAEAVSRFWPEARFFDYHRENDPGLIWQTNIDDAIENCGKVIALLSPEYFASPECTEELMIARLRNKREGGGVLLPVYWRSLEGDLALWLQIINYADCRESDAALLQAFANRLHPGAGAS